MKLATVTLGKSEFTTGLTYVALSRMRSLDGLCLAPGVDADQLYNTTGCQALTP